MPTYVCTVPKGLLSDPQQSAVAKAISRLHSEATGAPTHFVQVLIDETEKARFLGGERVERGIWVRGDIRAGRAEAVREAMMLKMMREISAISGVGESQVWIYLCNLAPTDMIEYGHVLPAPGQERAWFDALPPDLQAYLNGLGTDREGFTL